MISGTNMYPAFNIPNPCTPSLQVGKGTGNGYVACGEELHLQEGYLGELYGVGGKA